MIKWNLGQGWNCGHRQILCVSVNNSSVSAIVIETILKGSSFMQFQYKRFA